LEIDRLNQLLSNPGKCSCHAERSEASQFLTETEILRVAQNDIILRLFALLRMT